MNFTNELQSQILSILADPEEKTPTGHCCRFVDLGDGVGAKIYGDRKTATEKGQAAYESQKKAYEHGIAPAVGDEFTIRLRLGSKQMIKIYGYLTEVAKPAGDSVYDCQDYRDLLDEMEEIGFLSYDVSDDNCGWIDGKLVCIDFDPASISHGPIQND
jgi:hypothetical protein